MKDLKDMPKEEKKDIAQAIFETAELYTNNAGDLNDKFKEWLTRNFTFIVSKAGVEAHYQPESPITKTAEEIKKQFGFGPELQRAEPKIQLSDEDTNPEVLQAEVTWRRDQIAHLQENLDIANEFMHKQNLFIENLIQLQRE